MAEPASAVVDRDGSAGAGAAATEWVVGGEGFAAAAEPLAQHAPGQALLAAACRSSVGAFAPATVTERDIYRPSARPDLADDSAPNVYSGSHRRMMARCCGRSIV